jgi:hypothetical protein
LRHRRSPAAELKERGLWLWTAAAVKAARR